MSPWGQQTFHFVVKIPEEHGTYTLKATATSSDGASTVSSRWVTIGDKLAPGATSGQDDSSFGQKLSDQ